MPEVIGLGLFLGAIVVTLTVLVVWDFQRQRLRLGSAQYEARIQALEDRITELELENVRLREELQWMVKAAPQRSRLSEGPKTDSSSLRSSE